MNLNNFHSLEVVDRVSETQLQVGENSNSVIWRLEGNPVAIIFVIKYFISTLNITFRACLIQNMTQINKFAKSFTSILSNLIIFTHLKLWIASARHNKYLRVGEIRLEG